jgi:hypothetical protein
MRDPVVDDLLLRDALCIVKNRRGYVIMLSLVAAAASLSVDSVLCQSANPLSAAA